MAARTIVGTGGTGLVALVRDSSATITTALATGILGQAIDATNGNYIAGGSFTALQDARKLIVLVKSTTAAGTLTVRATGSGVDANGNAQVSPYPSNSVFTQGAQGDLNVAIGAGTVQVAVGPFTTDRFLQPDGNIYLDWAGLTSATFSVLQIPFNVV